jgi:hypothetical protein
MMNNNTIKHQKTQTTFFIPILAHTRRENKQKASRFLFYNSGIQILKATQLYKHISPPPHPPPSPNRTTTAAETKQRIGRFAKSNDRKLCRNQTKNWKIRKRAMTKSYAKCRTGNIHSTRKSFIYFSYWFRPKPSLFSHNNERTIDLQFIIHPSLRFEL